MRRLKILIVIMVILLVFMLWYNQWHSEDVILDFQPISVATGAVAETGNVLTWAIQTWATQEETAIYTWEQTEDRIVAEVNKKIGNESISQTVVHECVTKTDDYKLCIKNLLGVANAESSLFKKGMYPSNNWFGLMQRTSKGYIKRKFSSVDEWIRYWVDLYVKKWRGKRKTWADWLKWNYCTSACSGWTKAYNAASKWLELE